VREISVDELKSGRSNEYDPLEYRGDLCRIDKAKLARCLLLNNSPSRNKQNLDNSAIQFNTIDPKNLTKQQPSLQREMQQ